jgi:DNA-directed RNA polymerase subunit RPC12/RpoP
MYGTFKFHILFRMCPRLNCKKSFGDEELQIEDTPSVSCQRCGKHLANKYNLKIHVSSIVNLFLNFI